MLILINLESALGRRASMEAQLQAAGLAAERVGIDLRGVARADAREMARRAFPAFRFGGLLSGPEIGCWLSHLTAWQRAIEARVPACTVIEDDLVLQPHFAEAHRQLTRATRARRHLPRHVVAQHLDAPSGSVRPVPAASPDWRHPEHLGLCRCAPSSRHASSPPAAR